MARRRRTRLRKSRPSRSEVPRRLRLVEQHVADEPQDVAGALARRHEALDAVGELDEADAVVVADGAEGQHGGQLGGDLALLLAPRAELVAAAAIDGQQHGQLALLDEALDERMAHAGGDVPVDGAHVVAGLVLAHLLEGDAGALEDAVILAAEQVLDGAAGLQLQAADLAQHLAGQHGGRLTAGDPFRLPQASPSAMPA